MRIRVNDETGLFSMKLEDGAAWEADAQILGSFSEDDEGWQWAWGNPHCAEIGPATAKSSAKPANGWASGNSTSCRCTRYPDRSSSPICVLSGQSVQIVRHVRAQDD